MKSAPFTVFTRKWVHQGDVARISHPPREKKTTYDFTFTVKRTKEAKVTQPTENERETVTEGCLVPNEAEVKRDFRRPINVATSNNGT